MNRIAPVDPATAQGRTRELFAVVQQTFGTIPNATKVMANSPPVLESFLAFSAAMGGVAIGNPLHTQLKLTASESNECHYCTALLSAVAPGAGLTPADVLSGRTASATDPRVDAGLKFGRAVLESRGQVSDEAIQAARRAGLSDADLVETVASVVLGCFTNFLNNVAQTELDFERAEPLARVA